MKKHFLVFQINVRLKFGFSLYMNLAVFLRVHNKENFTRRKSVWKENLLTFLLKYVIIVTTGEIM